MQHPGGLLRAEVLRVRQCAHDDAGADDEPEGGSERLKVEDFLCRQYCSRSEKGEIRCYFSVGW